MKKIISVLLAVLLTAALFCLGACGDDSSDKKSEYKAEMTFKDFGSITLTLKRSFAPITVDHFVKLAKDGSYDGTVITRMQAGFVLQGGDKCKDKSTIKGEFASNGVTNLIAHKKGVISMARTTEPDSASSQFFIVLDDAAQPSLDGNYAGFGEVTEGWDVIEKICASFTAEDFTDDYYGQAMGFLKEDSQIVIESVKILED